MVPVTRQVVLDGDTPVSAFAKLHRGPYGFLLESLEGGERWARYTFLSTDPREVYRYHGREVRRWTARTGWQTVATDQAPLDHLAARRCGSYPPVDLPGAAPLHRRGGGLHRVRCRAQPGAAAGRAARRSGPARRHPDGGRHPAGARQPLQPRHDHRQRRGRGRHVRRRRSRRDYRARRRPDRRLARAACAAPTAAAAARHRGPAAAPGARPRRPPSERFQDDVRRIQEYIAAGDTFQTVLSRRLDLEAPGSRSSPIATCGRSIRRPTSTSCTSTTFMSWAARPEVLIRVEEGEVTVRPIAGTRPRGATAEQDQALQAELEADPKERAEHLMLVDLGRNDVGPGRAVRHRCGSPPSWWWSGTPT